VYQQTTLQLQGGSGRSFDDAIRHLTLNTVTSTERNQLTVVADETTAADRMETQF